MVDILTPEEKFTVVAVQRAKEILSPTDQKYVTHTRLNKMVCILADYMNFDLTRGWFKFGYYSPTVNKFLPESGLVELSFGDPILKSAFEFFGNVNINKIDVYIRHKIRDMIHKDKNIFYGWIYSELAPKECRELYQNSVAFRKRLKYLIEDIDSKPSDTVQTSREVEKYLFGIKRSLNYIQDERIIDIFLNYYDLLKIVTIKFRATEDKEKRKFKIVYNNLFYIFLNESLDIDANNLLDISRFRLFKPFNGDMWTILTPYRETLKGANKEVEIKEHAKRIEVLIPQITNALEEIKEYCIKNGLYPTPEEVREHLRELREKTTPPLREVYAEL